TALRRSGAVAGAATAPRSLVCVQRAIVARVQGLYAIRCHHVQGLVAFSWGTAHPPARRIGGHVFCRFWRNIPPVRGLQQSGVCYTPHVIVANTPPRATILATQGSRQALKGHHGDSGDEFPTLP